MSRTTSMHGFQIATLMLLGPLAGTAASQREALTLVRLGGRSDAAGLFRVEGPAPGDSSAVQVECLEPLKGVAIGQRLLLASQPCPCCQCHFVELASVAPGTRLLLFLSRLPEGPYRQLPGGVLPGRPSLAKAVGELLAARDPEELALLLATQLGHEEGRVVEDALLSLLALPAPLLAQVRDQAHPRLLALLKVSVRTPGPFTTWKVRLADRLELKEALPELIQLLLKERELSGARGFLLDRVRSLDAPAAARLLSELPASEPAQALVVARLLRELAHPGVEAKLAELATHPQPQVRIEALTGLARLAPAEPALAQALRTDPAVAPAVVVALLHSSHPEAARVLQEATGLDPTLAMRGRALPGRSEGAPRFRAIDPGRRSARRGD